MAKQIAKDINKGCCWFCGDTLYKCDDDGDMDCPTENWVTCCDGNCMTGAVSVRYCSGTHICPDDRDECPNFEDWHSDKCSDCDKSDCSECERRNNDCENCEDSGKREHILQIARILIPMEKTAVEENGRFVPVTLEKIRETIKEALDYIEEECDVSIEGLS